MLLHILLLVYSIFLQLKKKMYILCGKKLQVKRNRNKNSTKLFGTGTHAAKHINKLGKSSMFQFFWYFCLQLFVIINIPQTLENCDVIYRLGDPI